MTSKALDLEYILPKSLPRFVARTLSQVLEGPLGITKLNALHDRILVGVPSDRGVPGAGDAAQFALDDLGVRLRMLGSLEPLPEGPVVVVANHPFGGVEAVALVKMLAGSSREGRVMANGMLRIFPTFAPALIFVDPFGDRESAARNVASMKEARAHLKAGGLLGVFPAGSVATFEMKRKEPVEDPWSPSVSKLILGARATVVPVYFHGKNSALFQAVSLVSRTARLALIVRELMNKPPAELPVVVGESIRPEAYDAIRGAQALSSWLRDQCLALEAKLPHAVEGSQS